MQGDCRDSARALQARPYGDAQRKLPPLEGQCVLTVTHRFLEWADRTLWLDSLYLNYEGCTFETVERADDAGALSYNEEICSQNTDSHSI